MKLTAVFAALASVAEVAAAAVAASSSPTVTSMRRLESYPGIPPFWSPRSRRRALSPVTPSPSAVPRKRDDPAPALPPLSNIFEISEPIRADFETDSPSASPTGPVTSDPAPSVLPNASALPSLTDIFEINEPFPTDFETDSPGASPTGPVFSDPTPSGLPSSAGDSVWENAANHGCRLVDAMRVSDYEAGQLYNPPKTSAQSSLMSYDDFTGWGWNANEVDGNNFTDIDSGQKQPDPGWGIGIALRGLGVSDKIKAQGGKNLVFDAIHGKEPFTKGYTKDGKTYPVRERTMASRSITLASAFRFCPY